MVGPTLNLVASNAKHMTEKGHTAFNAGIQQCVAEGLVTYAKTNTGYKLTSKGKSFMSAMRTGIPLPKRD